MAPMCFKIMWLKYLLELSFFVDMMMKRHCDDYDVIFTCKNPTSYKCNKIIDNMQLIPVIT